MSNPADRRESQRIVVRLRVQFAGGGKGFVLHSENLSLGGIFLKDAHDVCSDGEQLTFDVVVPATDGSLETHRLRGTVVQLVPGIGAGVRFEWAADTLPSRDALVRFIDRVGMDNRPFVHSEPIGLATDAEEER